MSLEKQYLQNNLSRIKSRRLSNLLTLIVLFIIAFASAIGTVRCKDFMLATSLCDLQGLARCFWWLEFKVYFIQFQSRRRVDKTGRDNIGNTLALCSCQVTNQCAFMWFDKRCLSIHYTPRESKQRRKKQLEQGTNLKCSIKPLNLFWGKLT